MDRQSYLLFQGFSPEVTSDVPVVFDLFSRLGYMHGLWVLVARKGTRILVRYEAWLRPEGCGNER
jgi:hypothetical protein